MTDKQRAALLKSMWADLHKTELGYAQGKNGPNWKNADTPGRACEFLDGEGFESS